MLTQLKNGNVRDGVNVAAQMLAPQRPEATQQFGYAVMQHLVRIVLPSRLLLTSWRLVIACERAAGVQVGTRWGEFSDDEHAELAKLAFNMVTQGARPSRAALRLPVISACRTGCAKRVLGFGRNSSRRTAQVAMLSVCSWHSGYAFAAPFHLDNGSVSTSSRC